MAGRIWIPPYKPLGVSTQAVPGGGYINVAPSVAQFGWSVLGSLGRQVAEGAAGISGEIAKQLAGDNEAVVKAADVRLGEAEQMLLVDPQNGYLNTQGQVALTHAPAMIEAYTQAQDRELAQTTDDDQRQMLQGLNERRLADFTTLVERHTAAERQRWYDEAGERRIAQMQADARLHWSDDALLRRALGTTRFEVREKAERKGWDTALTEAALRQHTSRILVSAIEGAVERDLDRAQAVRARYDQHIEGADRAALDALLSEAQTRRRVEAVSTEILNATPPDGEQSTPQWRLHQAEAITEPAVRAATIRRVLRVDAEAQARARALAEQVLARVLKDGLTDPSQIPIREWATLDAYHRQAIETRLDHNAAGTEPTSNPALVDELATQMTQAPDAFARRDLVPTIAHLPLPQWRRFHDWRTGLQRNDPATEDQLYAIKRGLQLASKMLPADAPDDSAANYRTELVEEIDTWRRIHGKSPDEDDIADMLRRIRPLKPAQDWERSGARADRPGYYHIDESGRFFPPGFGKQFFRFKFPKMSPRQADNSASALGFKKVDKHPVDAQGRPVYVNPKTGEYISPSRDPRTPAQWELFDRSGKPLGSYDHRLRARYPSPTPDMPVPIPVPPGATAGSMMGGATQAGSPKTPPRPVTPPNPPSFLPSRVTFTDRKLQHEAKHAHDFGVQGRWNKEFAAQYEKALRAHMSAPGTVLKIGTYRNLPVIHYVNPNTGLNVMISRAGKYIAGWRLSADQLKHVMTTGKLGGGP